MSRSASYGWMDGSVNNWNLKLILVIITSAKLCIFFTSCPAEWGRIYFILSFLLHIYPSTFRLHVSTPFFFWPNYRRRRRKWKWGHVRLRGVEDYITVIVWRVCRDDLVGRWPLFNQVRKGGWRVVDGIYVERDNKRLRSNWEIRNSSGGAVNDSTCTQIQIPCSNLTTPQDKNCHLNIFLSTFPPNSLTRLQLGVGEVRKLLLLPG